MRAVRAGVDLLCIGNNLRYEPEAAAEVARAIAGDVDPGTIAAAIARVADRKRHAEAGTVS